MIVPFTINSFSSINSSNSREGPRVEHVELLVPMVTFKLLQLKETLGN